MEPVGISKRDYFSSLNFFQISPVSDIETNIRRLEKAQDEINAALANFRSVKALNGTTMDSRLLDSKGPPPPPPRPAAKIMSIVAMRKELFESQRKRSTLPHSKTAPDYSSFQDDDDDVDGKKEATSMTTTPTTDDGEQKFAA